MPGCLNRRNVITTKEDLLTKNTIGYDNVPQFGTLFYLLYFPSIERGFLWWITDIVSYIWPQAYLHSSLLRLFLFFFSIQQNTIGAIFNPIIIMIGTANAPSKSIVLFSFSSSPAIDYERPIVTAMTAPAEICDLSVLWSTYRMNAFQKTLRFILMQTPLASGLNLTAMETIKIHMHTTKSMNANSSMIPMFSTISVDPSLLVSGSACCSLPSSFNYPSSPGNSSVESLRRYEISS